MNEMTVLELRSFGLDGLAEAARPLPEPGPGQVRLRMRAASLNYRDLLTIKGLYNPRQPLPLVPLSDGVGVVEALGPGVSRWKVGDRACPIFAQEWLCGPPAREALRSTLGGPLDGTLAEFMVVGEQGLVPAPAHLSDPEAACLPCAALTAWNALVTLGGAKPGETVLVLGTGGVSIFALQFARLLGARVIATTSKKEKEERLRGLGAQAVLDYREEPKWGRKVRELSGGGVDLVVEVGGAGTLEQSLQALRPGGRISLIGVLSGARSQVDVIPILMNQVRVQGVFVGSRENFLDMNRAVSFHGLRPVVDRVFPFREAREALAYLESGRHFGKVCLEFPG